MRAVVADGYGEPDKAGCAGAMRFDDEAVDNVQVFEPFDATIHGTFRPESKVHGEPRSGLGRLDGLRVQGRWELQVGDIDSFESQATLECFKLRITYQPA